MLPLLLTVCPFRRRRAFVPLDDAHSFRWIALTSEPVEVRDYSISFGSLFGLPSIAPFRLGAAFA